MDANLMYAITETQAAINREFGIKINYGGCGHFALSLSKKLHSHNIPFKYVYWIPEHSNFKNLADVINSINLNNSGQPNNISPTHMMIKIGKWYIDGVNLVDALEDLEYYDQYKFYSKNIVEFSLNPEELEVSINNSIWNDWHFDFNDKKNQNLIHTIVNTNFNI